MKRFFLYRLEMLAMLFVLFSGGVLFGYGYMDDSSSTYIDSWGAEAGLYGYGSTDPSHPMHDYAVDVTITSPDSRQASQTGWLTSGWASTQTFLAWDSSDLGTYLVETTHRGYCWISFTDFTLTMLLAEPLIGYAVTYYTDPINQIPVYGVCIWASLACTSGTPTCPYGFSLGDFEDPEECPEYWRTVHLTFKIGSSTSCFKIGRGEELGTPGACN